MFAVIKTGGKQYKISSNDVIVVEKLEGDSGTVVTLSDVLMLNTGEKTIIGTPTVLGAEVKAKIVEQTRGPKVIIFKKRRRKNYRRKKGHRQDYTVLRVMDIKAS